MNDLLVRALRGERTERTPIWLMRQAGRTDPRYLALKEREGLSLEGLFRHPQLAAEISLMPRRLGVDAIIFFQDILTLLSPMGAHFTFAPGPVLTGRIDTVRQVDELRLFEVEDHLDFVQETLQRLNAGLDGSLPVLGFAGAPLTLAMFILEGKSFADRSDRAMYFLRQHSSAAHRLLDKLTEMTVAYLRYQAKAGVAAVQLFESAAFLLSEEVYREFALPYQRRIFAALKGVVTTIHFARNWQRLEDLDAAGADVVSLPSSISILEARRQLGEARVFQGNVDNELLARGTLREIGSAARRCVQDGAQRGHIFNLSHGLLRQTPYENILHLVETVRQTAV